MLVVGVAIVSGAIGTALAWLTAICEFPGRRFFDWALLMPLAIPAYVLAFVAVGFLDYAGPLQSWLRAAFGTRRWVAADPFAGGVILVLSLALYPYVYLLARSAFLTQGRRALEAAQTLGLGDGRRPGGGAAAGATVDRGRRRASRHGDAGRFRRRVQCSTTTRSPPRFIAPGSECSRSSGAGTGCDPHAARAARARLRARTRAGAHSARAGRARVAAAAIARRLALGRERACDARVRAGVRPAVPATAVVGHHRAASDLDARYWGSSLAACSSRAARQPSSSPSASCSLTSLRRTAGWAFVRGVMRLATMGYAVRARCWRSASSAPLVAFNNAVQGLLRATWFGHSMPPPALQSTCGRAARLSRTLSRRRLQPGRERLSARHAEHRRSRRQPGRHRRPLVRRCICPCCAPVSRQRRRWCSST